MKRGKRFWQRMLTIVCLGVFIYSGTAIGFELFGYYQNRQVLAKAQTMYGHQEEMTEKREPGKIRSSFDELRKVNEDIVGWINMKDTMIQYPIVQSRDNAFYLTRNYLKNDTRAGSIFMDYRNDVLHESPNTVVYGHRMRDGSMFAGLTNYLKKISSKSTGHFSTIRCIKAMKRRFLLCMKRRWTSTIFKPIFKILANMRTTCKLCGRNQSIKRRQTCPQMTSSSPYRPVIMCLHLKTGVSWYRQS